MDPETGRSEETIGLMMTLSKDQISVRRFRDSDAHFCFRTRANAFQTLFKDEIGEEAAAAAINSYQPSDYTRIARDTEFFIVEVDERSAGFFIIRRIDPRTAELVLIYLDAEFISLGLGRFCCNYLERWIARNWKEVTELYVDTVIPRYNGQFYEKMGFQQTKTVVCHFPGVPVAAIRLVKKLVNH